MRQAHFPQSGQGWASGPREVKGVGKLLTSGWQGWHLLPQAGGDVTSFKRCAFMFCHFVLRNVFMVRMQFINCL